MKLKNRLNLISMNLIYVSVFCQKSYIALLKLLFRSMSMTSTQTADILIFTSAEFQPIIEKEIEEFGFVCHYSILPIHTIMDASCCKLKIFDYEHIAKYKKIVYLDTDVLINSNINRLFDVEISDEKLYALEEGRIGDIYWGSEFFDFTTIDRNTPAFSAGVFYFMNSAPMRELFESTNKHIAEYLKYNRHPECLDQPFLVYNSFVQNKYDNQLMKLYLENNPTTSSPDKIVYHFPGWPGNSVSKLEKMTAFFDTIYFDTRNEMMRYVCNQLKNPKIVEIGTFRGEFLDYMATHCKYESIDAVDVFDGITCSGDADGNNVVHYDTRLSFLQLCEKYKPMPNIRINKADSKTFLQSQNNDTFDIIYIDGDHSYTGVKSDLFHAYAKIKHKGYIMGHDYEMNMRKAHTVYSFGVKQAVDEFCVQFNQKICTKALDGCVSFCIQVNKECVACD